MRFWFAALAVCLALCVSPARAQDAPKAPKAPDASDAPPAAAADYRPSEIMFSGKLYSPVKLSVLMPYTSQVLSLDVRIGQEVAEDQVLLTYKIPLQTRMEEKSNLSVAGIKELEYKLAAAENEITRLSAKSKELNAMVKKNMASKEALSQNQKDIQVHRKERRSILEKLALARSVLKDRLALAEEYFGKDVNPGDVPETGVVKAPASGYILWMNPELREGVKLAKESELFQVGSINPMIIRAQVHEIEAQKLTEGDIAKVTFDSTPGREFTASVSRIPWAPMPAALQQPSYYEVELIIPNPDLILKEGLKGQVTVLPQKQP